MSHQIQIFGKKEDRMTLSRLMMMSKARNASLRRWHWNWNLNVEPVLSLVYHVPWWYQEDMSTRVVGPGRCNGGGDAWGREWVRGEAMGGARWRPARLQWRPREKKRDVNRCHIKLESTMTKTGVVTTLMQMKIQIPPLHNGQLGQYMQKEGYSLHLELQRLPQGRDSWVESWLRTKVQMSSQA